MVDSGFRVVPVSLMFKGSPGVGKSLLMEVFTKELLMRILPQKEREHFSKNHASQLGLYFYNRQSENKFWDGYAQQTVTLFDDFG